MSLGGYLLPYSQTYNQHNTCSCCSLSTVAVKSRNLEMLTSGSTHGFYGSNDKLYVSVKKLFVDKEDSDS